MDKINTSQHIIYTGLGLLTLGPHAQRGYCSCPLCVFALICHLTYWNHKSEVPTDSSQYRKDFWKVI